MNVNSARIELSRIESFFREAMSSKALWHGVKVEGENFVLFPLCNGFQFKEGNLRLGEVVKEYGGGKSHRTVTIYFRGKEVWKWMQDISIGKESCFLAYARLRNWSVGFFLNQPGHDTYFPDKGASIGYESIDLSSTNPSSFGKFCCREAIITIPDPKSRKSLNEMLMLCISSGGFVTH